MGLLISVCTRRADLPQETFLDDIQTLDDGVAVYQFREEVAGACDLLTNVRERSSHVPTMLWRMVDTTAQDLLTVKPCSSTHNDTEAFDLPSFFQLHDLNRDGVWDKEEIEAVYGVHHIYSQKKSKDDFEHQKKSDTIVKSVLEKLDSNGDGKITVEEFEAVGLDGLPNFDRLGAEGHHYDVESEFFLHHEEEFHSTPETQTDESYDHPEDLEHFAHHERIELEEAKKEANYEGLSVAEVLEAHERAEEEAAAAAAAAQESVRAAHPDDEAVPIDPHNSKIQRVTPPEKQDPSIRYKGAKEEGASKSDWGAGESGYLPPTDPSDKMRRNTPYKYKFKRSWNDF